MNCIWQHIVLRSKLLNFSAHALFGPGYSARLPRTSRTFCGLCLQWNIKVCTVTLVIHGFLVEIFIFLLHICGDKTEFQTWAQMAQRRQSASVSSVGPTYLYGLAVCYHQFPLQFGPYYLIHYHVPSKVTIMVMSDGGFH